MGMVGKFFASLYRDGFRALTAIAPLLSIAFIICKIFDAMSVLRHLSYAWALLPITIWLFVAYTRRFFISEAERGAIQKKYDALLDQYPHSLRLNSVDLTDIRKLDPADPTQTKIIGREISFILHWKNSIARPIEYRITELSINGHQTPVGGIGEVISGSAETSFYTGSISVPLPAGNARETYIIDLKLLYGRPNVPLSRIVEKRINYDAIIPDPRLNHFVYEKNTDEPCVV